MSRPLRVFLCHASQDKPAISELFNALKAERWIDPWLDKAKILPGQDWRVVIEKAVEDSDVVIVCLSNQSVNKEGFVQKEIRYVSDIALEKPEETIFLIPLRLEDCSLPRGLRSLHRVDYFGTEKNDHYANLLEALKLRHVQKLKQEAEESKWKRPTSLENNIEPVDKAEPVVSQDIDLDLYRFVQIPSTEEVPYSFYIGKYPVTNAQYERFLNAPDFGEKSLWVNFPKYNEDCILIGKWGNEGWDWLQESLDEYGGFPRPGKWDDEIFGISSPENPVVSITWYETNAYCNWLLHHWSELTESYVNQGLQPRIIRLSLETEWVTAAGGEIPAGRYPWDTTGIVTKNKKEIVRRANIEESNIGHTTPVNAYLLGTSPHHVRDMTGNVWEWQGNFYDKDHDTIAERGGSWLHYEVYAGVADRGHDNLRDWSIHLGFRMVLLPSR